MIANSVLIFIASALTFVEGISSIPKWVTLPFFSFFMILSIINLIFEGYLFISREESKLKLLKHKICSSIFGEYWEFMQMNLKFEGKSNYCNPFSNSPVWCSHNMHIMSGFKSTFDFKNSLSRSIWESYTNSSFDNAVLQDDFMKKLYYTIEVSGEGKQCDIINKLNILNMRGLAKDGGYDEKYLHSYLNLLDAGDSEKFENLGKNKNTFIKSMLLSSLILNINVPNFKLESGVKEGSISLQYKDGGFFMYYSVLKRKMDIEFVNNANLSDVIHFLDIMDEILRSNRFCCFVCDGNTCVKKTIFNKKFSYGHSMSFKKLFVNTLDGFKFELVKNVNGVTLFEGQTECVERLFYSDMIRSRFGFKFLNLLEEYLKDRYYKIFKNSVEHEKLYNKILEEVAMKVDIKAKNSEVGNWQWMRFITDMSYVREKMGFNSYSNTNLGINPTLLVQHLVRKHQIIDEGKDKMFELKNFQLQIPKELCKKDKATIKKEILKDLKNLGEHPAFEVEHEIKSCCLLIKERIKENSTQKFSKRKNYRRIADTMFRYKRKTDYYTEGRLSNKGSVEEIKNANLVNIKTKFSKYDLYEKGERILDYDNMKIESISYFKDFYTSMWGDGTKSNWDPPDPPEPVKNKELRNLDTMSFGIKCCIGNDIFSNITENQTNIKFKTVRRKFNKIKLNNHLGEIKNVENSNNNKKIPEKMLSKNFYSPLFIKEKIKEKIKKETLNFNYKSLDYKKSSRALVGAMLTDFKENKGVYYPKGTIDRIAKKVSENKEGRERDSTREMNKKLGNLMPRGNTKIQVIPLLDKILISKSKEDGKAKHDFYEDAVCGNMRQVAIIYRSYLKSLNFNFKKILKKSAKNIKCLMHSSADNEVGKQFIKSGDEDVSKTHFGFDTSFVRHDIKTNNNKKRKPESNDLEISGFDYIYKTKIRNCRNTNYRKNKQAVKKKKEKVERHTEFPKKYRYLFD